MKKKSMGEFIAALRKAKGYTQQDVADRLDVSNKAVSRWERDECAPDISVIPALAELLEVTCDELLRGEKCNSSMIVSERGEAKVDKQVKFLMTRTISKIKMMSWISIGVAVSGFVLMITLELLVNIPIVGIAIMLLFEISAAVVALIGINKAKEAKEDNDLTGRLGAKDMEVYNKTLDKFAFWNIAIILMVVSTIIPMFCVRWRIQMVDNFVECSAGVFTILLSVYFFVRDIVRKNFTGECVEKKKRLCRVMNAIHILVIGVLLMIGVVYRVNNEIDLYAGLEYHNAWLVRYGVCAYIGLGIILVSMILAMVFSKGRRRFVTVNGIRNLLIAVVVVDMISDYRIRFLMYSHADDKLSPLFIGIIIAIIIVARIVKFILEKRSQTD